VGIYVCVCVRSHVWVYMCVCVCVHEWVYVCMNVCVYAYMYACVQVCCPPPVQTSPINGQCAASSLSFSLSCCSAAAALWSAFTFPSCSVSYLYTHFLVWFEPPMMCSLARSGCLNSFLHLRQYSFLLLPLPSTLKRSSSSKAAAATLPYRELHTSSAIDINYILEYYNLFFLRPFIFNHLRSFSNKVIKFPYASYRTVPYRTDVRHTVRVRTCVRDNTVCKYPNKGYMGPKHARSSCARK